MTVKQKTIMRGTSIIRRRSAGGEWEYGGTAPQRRARNRRGGAPTVRLAIAPPLATAAR
jgi:hypothetical protein